MTQSTPQPPTDHLTQQFSAPADAEFLQFALDRLGDGVFWLNSAGQVLYVNDAACRMLEYSRAELLACRVGDFDLNVGEDVWANSWQMAQTMNTLSLETRYRTRSGQVFPVEVTLSYLQHGKWECCCLSARNISRRKQMEEAANLAVAIYMSSSEAVVVTDENNRIVQINPALTRITGYTLDELYGKNPGFLKSELHDTTFYQTMWQTLLDSGYWQGELWDKRKNGEPFASWVTISLIKHPDGRIFRHVAQFSDITEKKKKDDLIWHHANFDALTGLPNRRLFNDRLEQEMKKAHRTGHHLSLLFIDLDDFKQINDQLGHDMGDQLLVETARRISGCVRSTDTVARLGGDEFTVILPEFGHLADVERIVQAILRELTTPFQLGAESGTISASVGIALYPADAEDISSLLVSADRAMYRAKTTGRNNFSYVPARSPRNADLTRHSHHLKPPEAC